MEIKYKLWSKNKVAFICGGDCYEEHSIANVEIKDTEHIEAYLKETHIIEADDKLIEI